MPSRDCCNCPSSGKVCIAVCGNGGNDVYIDAGWESSALTLRRRQEKDVAEEQVNWENMKINRKRN